MTGVDKPTNDGQIQVLRNEKGQIMPGSVLNPNGKPIGSGQRQRYEQMLQKVADKEGLSIKDAELELFMTAYEMAKKGNYQYFKDFMDRNYGPVNSGNTNINVEKAVIPIYGGLSVQQHNSNEEDI